MTWKETFNIALQSVLSNKLRTLITIAIITLGLTALVGILTSIEAMKRKLKESFSFMGANTFTIRATERKINLGGTSSNLRRKTENVQQAPVANITLEEAQLFSQNFEVSSTVSVRAAGQQSVAIQKNDIVTDPVYTLFAGDQNYLNVFGFNVAKGRNYNAEESKSGAQVCIIGTALAQRIYKNNFDAAIGDQIKINGNQYTILGVLASKGSGAFVSFDNVIIVPATAAVKHFKFDRGFFIGVKVNQVQDLESAIQQSTALLKSIRRIPITEEANFAFEKSDRLATIFINATNTITFAAIAIGLITLIGAAIGLMNIMLVSVNERTKEVGLLKAIGADAQSIKRMFLAESILIALGGAALGTVVGLLVGNLVGYFLKVPFFVPWGWISLGIVLCTISGILAGLYPSNIASKLNPIEALRYD